MIKILGPIFLFVYLFTPGISKADSAYELKAIMGVGWSQPKELNEGLNEKLQVNALLTFGSDFLVFPKLSSDWLNGSVGIGLRFDSISSIKSSDGEAFEVASRNFSILVDKRWQIEQFFYGIVGAVAFYQPTVVNQQQTSGVWTQYEAQNSTGFSIGVNSGWIFDIYVLGGEFGYQYLRFNEFKSTSSEYLTSSTGNHKSANLDHLFGKIYLGLHF